MMRFRTIQGLAAAAVVAASLAVFAAPASAHVLQVDGSIGAILHVDPNDDPIAGQPAAFFFDFSDKQNKFSPAECQCIASIISSSGATLFSTPLFNSTSQNNFNDALFQYTFAQGGVYQVKVVGNPDSAGQFQPFTLTYDIRVERPAAVATANQHGFGSAIRGFLKTEHGAHIVLFGIAFIIIGILFLVDHIKSGKIKKEERKEKT